MENKVVGDLNIATPGGQFREQGTLHIIEPPLSGAFHSIYSSIDLKYAHFADFTNTYPHYSDPSKDSIIAPNGVPTILFDDFRLRSADETEDAHLTGDTPPQWNAMITDYLPWVQAVDMAREVTYAFTVRLHMKNPAKEFSAVTPDSYGFVVKKNTADDSPPTPGSSDNTLWKLIITPSAGSIEVKAFGLMYDISIITP